MRVTIPDPRALRPFRLRPETTLARHGLPDGGEALVLTPAEAPRAVVAVAHGGGNDRLYGFWRLFPHLLAAGCAVATTHLPGHGAGATDVFTPEAVRLRLDALVAIAGASGRPVVLLGQSMGGAFALDAVARGTPAAAVVALSTPLEIPARMALWRELGASLSLEAWGMLTRVSIYDMLPSFGSFKREALPIRVTPGRPYVQAFRDALALLDLEARLADSRPTVPALIAHGEGDGIIPAAHAPRLAEAYGPDATLALWRGGHHLDLLLRAHVLDDVMAWLEATILP